MSDKWVVFRGHKNLVQPWYAWNPKGLQDVYLQAGYRWFGRAFGTWREAFDYADRQARK